MKWGPFLNIKSLKSENEKEKKIAYSILHNELYSLTCHCFMPVSNSLCKILCNQSQLTANNGHKKSERDAISYSFSS